MRPSSHASCSGHSSLSPLRITTCHADEQLSTPGNGARDSPHAPVAATTLPPRPTPPHRDLIGAVYKQSALQRAPRRQPASVSRRTSLNVSLASSWARVTHVILRPSIS